MRGKQYDTDLLLCLFLALPIWTECHGEFNFVPQSTSSRRPKSYRKNLESLYAGAAAAGTNLQQRPFRVPVVHTTFVLIRPDYLESREMVVPFWLAGDDPEKSRRSVAPRVTFLRLPPV